jgi:AcrR family transcriptional regulator
MAVKAKSIPKAPQATPGSTRARAAAPSPKPPQSAPIWSEPAPGRRRPRLSREQIAQAALAIADREGFAAVSMRRVAEELGAATMTLYYYIRTKDDLVALMDDALMAEVHVTEDVLALGWREALAAIARKTRDAFMNHPWALYELRGVRSGPNAMVHVEQSLTAVADCPLDDAGRLQLLGIVDDFAFGHALRAQTRWHRPDEGVEDIDARQRMVAFMRELMGSGRYPRLAAMVGPIAEAGPNDDARAEADGGDQNPWSKQDPEQAFERGLAAILDAAPSWAEAPRKRRPRR